MNHISIFSEKAQNRDSSYVRSIYEYTKPGKSGGYIFYILLFFVEIAAMILLNVNGLIAINKTQFYVGLIPIAGIVLWADVLIYDCRKHFDIYKKICNILRCEERKEKCYEWYKNSAYQSFKYFQDGKPTVNFVVSILVAFLAAFYYLYLYKVKGLVVFTLDELNWSATLLAAALGSIAGSAITPMAYMFFAYFRQLKKTLKENNDIRPFVTEDIENISIIKRYYMHLSGIATTAFLQIIFAFLVLKEYTIDLFTIICICIAACFPVLMIIACTVSYHYFVNALYDKFIHKIELRAAKAYEVFMCSEGLKAEESLELVKMNNAMKAELMSTFSHKITNNLISSLFGFVVSLSNIVACVYAVFQYNLDKLA